MRTNMTGNRARPVFATTLRLVCVGLLSLLVAGCASNVGLGKVVNQTLQTVGLKEVEPQPRDVRLRVHAAQNLNTGNDNRASAVVIKVYHLRSAQKFEQATFEALLDASREREALGDDLLGVEEIVLSPGIRHDAVETLPPEAGVLGVVALFRSPAERRWRLSYDVTQKPVSREGITIGVHGCALTTQSPGLISRIAGDTASLASVRCGR